MIHVNVRKAKAADELEDTITHPYIIEVSVDGAKWATHWHIPARGDYPVAQDLNAQNEGRMYAAGISFGGGDVRMTAFGAEVYVPDMTTIRV